MNWLKWIELILEFIRTILKDKTPKGKVPLARLISVYRSKRFRKWLKEEKGLEVDD